MIAGLLVFVVLLVAPPALAGTAGPATVIDGNTLRASGTHYPNTS